MAVGIVNYGNDGSEALINQLLAAHNTSDTAHQDIRKAVQQATTAAETAQKTADKALKVISDIRATIEVVPSQSGVLSYTGSAQSPSWNSYDPDTLTLGGTTSGTNAGNYNATFTPKEGYHWSDGTNTAKTVVWTIDRAMISTVPSQSGSLTYSGSSKNPSWSGYDTTKMTIGGTTSGTNAGNYNATFTPKANYQWSDGSTAAKTVVWKINKAAGSLSLSPTSLTISGTSGTTKTITVTRAGNGTITATSSNSSVATVSVSGTTVTVTLKGNGSATVTVSVAEGTNHTAPSSKTCAVSGSTISTVLANNSWATIAQVSAAGNASSYWSVGDEKDITVNGETITMVIVGFNHDDLASGGKAGITFGMKHLMKDARRLNQTGPCVFTNTETYTWLQNTVFNGLPSDLNAVIKSVRKKTAEGGGSSIINTNSMKLFLFSEVEAFGTTTNSAVGEGTQYSYFSTVANRKKYMSNGTGSNMNWWLRSPVVNNDEYYDSYYCYVLSDGTAGRLPLRSLSGICFGFCV